MRIYFKGNALNLTDELFYVSFNKKIQQNFLVKIVIKQLSCIKLDAFSSGSDSLNFSFKWDAHKWKCKCMCQRWDQLEYK